MRQGKEVDGNLSEESSRYFIDVCKHIDSNLDTQTLSGIALKGHDLVGQLIGTESFEIINGFLGIEHVDLMQRRAPRLFDLNVDVVRETCAY
ncbi:hypothetical protein K402DRAFT_31852 [Aulographum hederae CBS 113979]|uniref:Uncharacterized protein n=1 Tax=Aulographum hederae CBS 113979 TaxID=1176131 RepID=A0A6G1H5F1_9PEZI|nr:hypothetical protein K402DRAFT_31852 [Aulographum hederae CBS 113979]